MKQTATAAALALLVAATPSAWALNTKGKQKSRTGRTDDTRVQQMRALDVNGDGVISRDEWRGDNAQFSRMDRNGDGVLSQADRNNNTRGNKGKHGKRGNSAANRFRGMDANGDGVISRSEWRGNDQSFRNHDRNGDGVISSNERD
ncbi:MAG TPA: hypothetical protein VJZ00_21880 [Thermoanaerobaculia bacterium]|nr:hypothetical protein [Thermoanaerobaculia bacterium]